MPKPARACAHPRGCPHLQPCPIHADKPWSRSKRQHHVEIDGRARADRNRQVIERDGGICYVCGRPGADEADHVIPLHQDGPDHESNMRAIHARPCHQAKTAREAAAARARPQ